VLRQLAEACLVQHIRVHAAPGKHGLFEKQTDSLERKLSGAEQSLTEVRQRYSGFALPEEREAFMERASDAQVAYE
jgi:hypothetical protein